MKILAPVLLMAVLSGCGPDYSPDKYNQAAVQQENKASKGVIIGVRPIDITPTGTTGAVVGAGAGGIAGSQAGPGVVSALGALGGSVVGGLVGSAAEKSTGDTPAFEYIVRKSNGDLVSVTQKDATALLIGTKVLVIAGAQARVVPDYTVTLEPEATPLPTSLPETPAVIPAAP